MLNRCLFAVSTMISFNALLGFCGQVSNVDRLQSEKTEERTAFATSVQQDRTQLINKLIAVIRARPTDTSFRSTFFYAVELLGDMRALEAVEPLSECLGYTPKYFWPSEQLPREYFYRCAFALRQIGEPSVGVLMERIDTARSKQEIEIAAWVIMETEGSDQSLCRLDKVIKEGEDKANYQKAKEFILTYKPTFPDFDSLPQPFGDFAASK